MARPSKNCATILIIEDDQPIRDSIQQALELEGYTVVSAADGQAGLEILRTIAHPCLILLDLMLPIMNGWEFLDEIRKQDSSNLLAAIPVVITSAARDAAQTAENKAQGFIKKPIDLELLLTTVRKFCGTPERP